MNTVARRCCPGCGAPAPLALGQDWCRYCKEFIGVTHDMAVAVATGPSSAQWDRMTDALENLGAAPYVHEDTGVDYIAQNLMADARRREANLVPVRPLTFGPQPIDWDFKFEQAGRAAVHVGRAIIIAAPLVAFTWFLASILMQL